MGFFLLKMTAKNDGQFIKTFYKSITYDFLPT